jgi:hypothetical protein
VKATPSLSAGTDNAARGLVIQTIDGDELKQPFCVRLRTTHLPNQLRQAGRQHGHWKLALARAV